MEAYDRDIKKAGLDARRRNISCIYSFGRESDHRILCESVYDSPDSGHRCDQHSGIGSCGGVYFACGFIVAIAQDD